MIQSILALLNIVDARPNRAVVLVPENSYEESLRALGCKYPDNPGRSALMTNGQLVTVMTSKTPVEEVTGEFDLYLSGWGRATPPDEKAMGKWTSKARVVYTEVS